MLKFLITYLNITILITLFSISSFGQKPSDFSYKIKSAITKFNKGDYNNSITMLKEISNKIKVNDLDDTSLLYMKDTYFYLGYNYYKIDNLSEALKYFNKSLNIDKNELRAVYLRSVIRYLLNKELDDAKKDFKKIVKKIPDSPIGKSSANYLIKLKKINNSDENNTYSKSLKLFRTSKYDESLSGFKKTAKNNPKNINALYYIGYCYYKLFEYKNALKYFNKALKIDPNDKITLYMKALTLDGLSKSSEADNIYSHLYSINPDGDIGILSKQHLRKKRKAKKTGNQYYFSAEASTEYDSNPSYIPNKGWPNSEKAESLSAISLSSYGELSLNKSFGNLIFSSSIFQRLYSEWANENHYSSLSLFAGYYKKLNSFRLYSGLLTSFSAYNFEPFDIYNSLYSVLSWYYNGYTYSKLTPKINVRNAVNSDYESITGYSGDLHLAQGILLFSKKLLIEPGFRFVWNKSNNTDYITYDDFEFSSFSYFASVPGIYISWFLPFKIRMASWFETYYKNYYDSTLKEMDVHTKFGLKLSKNIYSKFNAFIKISYYSNQSDSEYRDYTKFLISTGINFK